jgi:excisionase family DNA binding protein
MADHNRALSIKEFCERYGICLATAYTHIRSGKLRAVKLGRRTVLLAPDVEAWLASLPEFSAGALKQFRRPDGPFAATAKGAGKQPARRDARPAEQAP